ncbi:hypothetical protein [Streptomyces sp. NPDC001750]|uniref:hypothetical protein n=1 Tax=Streptomyces sp. NPDC001750 TaxID=3364607 RepID=UPI003695A688
MTSPLNTEAVRRDCAEAIAVAVDALTDGSEPPAAVVERLREALSGHVREQVDAVRERFADAAPGPLRDIVTKTLTIAEHVLAVPVQGGVADLLVSPQVARFLLLMHEEAEVFGASPEVPVPSTRA